MWSDFILDPASRLRRVTELKSICIWLFTGPKGKNVKPTCRKSAAGIVWIVRFYFGPVLQGHI